MLQKVLISLHHYQCNLGENTRNYTDIGINCAKKITLRDQFYQHFCHQSREAFAQTMLNTLSGTKIWQNCTKIRCSSAKAVAWDIQDNFSTNVGKTEQHLLRHLLYSRIFGIAQVRWWNELQVSIPISIFLTLTATIKIVLSWLPIIFSGKTPAYPDRGTLKVSF